MKKYPFRKTSSTFPCYLHKYSPYRNQCIISICTPKRSNPVRKSSIFSSFFLKCYDPVIPVSLCSGKCRSIFPPPIKFNKSVPSAPKTPSLPSRQQFWQKPGIANMELRKSSGQILIPLPGVYGATGRKDTNVNENIQYCHRKGPGLHYSCYWPQKSTSAIDLGQQAHTSSPFW